MAQKTIPQLQEATEIDENTLIPIDSGTQSFKISADNFAKGLRSLLLTARTVTENTAILASDEVIFSDSSSGDLTHALPPIEDTIGQTKIVKDVGDGSHTTTIQGDDTDEIDGENVYPTPLGKNDAIRLYNDGSSWRVI